MQETEKRDPPPYRQQQQYRAIGSQYVGAPAIPMEEKTSEEVVVTVPTTHDSFVAPSPAAPSNHNGDSSNGKEQLLGPNGASSHQQVLSGTLIMAMSRHHNAPRLSSAHSLCP
jgi:hypothetical protein